MIPLQAADWAFVADSWPILLEGLKITVLLTLTSIVLGFLAGLPAGVIEVYGDGPVRWAIRRGGVILRGTPIVVILSVVFFVLPLNLSAFGAATVGLGFRSAAYQSQIFRGTIQSIGEGQMEAARSIGLSKLAAIRHVIVPQALRRSIPGFQNEFTIVLKDTSVAFAIGLGELLTKGTNLYLSGQQSTAVLEIFLAVSGIYFVLTVSTNQGLERLADRFAVPGRGESA